MRAPDGASPAAIVAPPMPEPTIRMSGGAISMAQATRASLTGSKKTAFSMLKAKGTRSPGRMRGVGAHPRDHLAPAQPGHDIGIRARRLHHLHQAFGLDDMARIAVGPVGIGDRLGPDADQDVAALGGDAHGRAREARAGDRARRRG